MSIVFLNGCYQDDSHPLINVHDRGLLLGDGVFTTVKADQAELEHFSAHLARLRHSAQVFSLVLPYVDSEIKQQCRTLLKKNHLADKEASLRLTLTRGAGARGLEIPVNSESNFLITCDVLPQVKKKLTLTVSSIIKSSVSLLSRHKTLNYLENIMARAEAKKKGFDDALLLNEKDEIVSTSAANIFFIKGKAVYTPSLTSGALPGIMRAQVITHYQQQGVPVHEEKLTLQALASYDRCFITNSLIGQVPILKIERVDFVV